MSNVLGSRVVSERELHELFAEAILAGPPDSGRNPEIIAGMSTANSVDQPNVLRYTNPKAWDFVQYHASMSSQTASVVAVPLRVQLESAQDVTETTSIVMESFVLKLRTKLHLPQDRTIDPSTHLAELGVDSLVAVDLRMWFAKELGVDVAVLQILGGSSVEEIAGTAAFKFWQGTD